MTKITVGRAVRAKAQKASNVASQNRRNVGTKKKVGAKKKPATGQATPSAQAASRVFTWVELTRAELAFKLTLEQLLETEFLVIYSEDFHSPGAVPKNVHFVSEALFREAFGGSRDALKRLVGQINSLVLPAFDALATAVQRIQPLPNRDDDRKFHFFSPTPPPKSERDVATEESLKSNQQHGSQISEGAAPQPGAAEAFGLKSMPVEEEQKRTRTMGRIVKPAEEVTKRRVGRPATGRDPMLGVRVKPNIQKKARAKAETMGVTFSKFVTQALIDAVEGTSTISNLKPDTEMITRQIKNKVLHALRQKPTVR